MSEHVLITGGAGFIGSHLCDELLKQGYRVRILDNFSQQVHGSENAVPAYLNRAVEVIRGDVRDPRAVRDALKDVDAVYHLAAAVGVGQSMYEVEHYESVNNVGTAVLLEALIERPVRRLVVASSMSLYGEGLYQTASGEGVFVPERQRGQLERGQWELLGPGDEVLQPIPTPEEKIPSLASIYALTKFDQERMCLLIGKAYDIEIAALRFFNVYGPRQALSNPYTGVLAIFAARYLNGRAPMIFEDGRQRRDFVHVQDVVQGCRLALEVPEASGEVFNIGSGNSYSVLEIADSMGEALGRADITPEITQRYRVGDIRHCFADIHRARVVLGYAPQVDLETGMVELAKWLDGQTADDRVDQAREELSTRGLTLGG